LWAPRAGCAVVGAVVGAAVGAAQAWWWPTPGQRSPALQAVRRLQVLMVELLVGAKANPNIGDGKGCVPLQQAFSTMGGCATGGPCSACGPGPGAMQ
jgi:hypothetical protein